MTTASTGGEGPEILIERRDGVALLTFNRASLANAQGYTFGRNLIAALDEVEADRSVSAVVMTGAGKVFSGGGRMGEMMDPGELDMEVQISAIRDAFRAAERVRTIELPVIAALNGAAVGGGAALALACDLVVAAEQGSYRFPFHNLGAAAADMGCGFLLQRIVGTARARQILLTGANVDAQQGLAWGLFVDVVKREEVVDAAIALARSIITAGPRRAVAATKQVLLRGESTDYSTAVAFDLYVQNYMLNRPEHKQLLRAFVERKK